MKTLTFGEAELQGDAPGAARVTITCEDKQVVLPRMFLMDLLTAAELERYACLKAGETDEYYRDTLDLFMAIRKHLSSS